MTDTPTLAGLAAALGAAVDAVAAPVADAAELGVRLQQLEAVAAGVAAAAAAAPAPSAAERRTIVRDVTRARQALARCLRRRATVRELAAALTGAEAYASDGSVAPAAGSFGGVRRV